MKKTLEREPVVTLHPTIDTTAAPRDVPAGNYGAVRLNAVKHGILSDLVVLPHEDKEAFESLRAALVEEHAPNGMTELTLVEELAAIVWRKRRVLLAEGASIQHSLRDVIMGHALSVAAAAMPFEADVEANANSVRSAMLSSDELTDENSRVLDAELQQVRKADLILRRAAPNAYQKARSALGEQTREAWDALVAEGKNQPDSEGLSAFIGDVLIPLLRRERRLALHYPQIRLQVMGDSLRAQRLDTLGRYETHLDRKFERTLAMLLKLRELRGR